MADTENEIKTANPAKKKRKKFHLTTWIALASAIAAVVAAYISASSVNVAKNQNTVAEQQQLVTITVAIEQAFDGEQAAENQAAANLTGTAKSAAIVQAQEGINAETAAYGQAAVVLINDLHGNGVAGIEYIDVARALANYGDTPLAITYYNDAVNASLFDVPIRADALRAVATLYYSLGQNSIGHKDMVEAATIYIGRVEMNRTLMDSSIAEAYLSDAEHQILIGDCNIAATDITDAVRAVTPLGPGGANLIAQTLNSEDVTAYKKKCVA
jgi:hypothetical protein